MALRPAPLMHQYRGHVLVTGPAAEPITAAELRTYARADATLLADAEADALIEIARAFIEEKTGVAMIDQTWKLALDAWPGSYEPWWDGVRQGATTDLAAGQRSISLPRFPLRSVSGVTTYDEGSNATAVTVANVFDVDAVSKPGRLSLQSGKTWPAAMRPTNAIEIEYVAGYGANATAVPAPLKRAVTVMAGHMYEHRADCSPANAYVASGAQILAEMYAVRSI